MDVFFIISIFFYGFILAHRFTKKSNFPNNSWIYKLWVYHILFGIIFYWYSINNPSDAVKYWRIASESNQQQILDYLLQGSGTPFMYVINYFPANILGLSYFSGTILYTLIGFLAILKFIKITEVYVPYNSKMGKYKLFPLIFFLPNLHFWSVPIGKDTLSLLCIAFFVYSISKIKKNFLTLLFSLGLLYMIRPHVSLMLIISFGSIYLLNKKAALLKKIFLSMILLITGFFLLPKLMTYVDIKEASFESLSDSFTERANLLSLGSGSGLDISDYPFPIRIFTFLYRPTLIDINNIISLFAAIENLFLLFLTYTAFRFKPISTFKNSPFVVKGLFIFLVIGSISFGSTLGNMGIMLRMRNMFLPALIIYILWSLAFKKQFSNRRIVKKHGTPNICGGIAFGARM